MKITTFDPLIVSPEAADTIKVFEALGFEKTHAPATETEAGENHSVRMKDCPWIQEYPRGRNVRHKERQRGNDGFTFGIPYCSR